jgi:hypothetical protein
MYVEPNGHWLVDAAFLVMDVVDFVKKPSLSKAAWIVADVASFADPSGAASAAAHAAKGVHAAVRVAKEAKAAVRVAKKVEVAVHMKNCLNYINYE